MAAVRVSVLLFTFAFGLLLALSLPAWASGAGEPQDQIVLSGTVDVARGDEIGEVVVLHGTCERRGRRTR